MGQVVAHAEGGILAEVQRAGGRPHERSQHLGLQQGLRALREDLAEPLVAGMVQPGVQGRLLLQLVVRRPERREGGRHRRIGPAVARAVAEMQNQVGELAAAVERVVRDRAGSRHLNRLSVHPERYQPRQLAVMQQDDLVQVAVFLVGFPERALTT